MVITKIPWAIEMNRMRALASRLFLCMRCHKWYVPINIVETFAAQHLAYINENGVSFGKFISTKTPTSGKLLWNCHKLVRNSDGCLAPHMHMKCWSIIVLLAAAIGRKFRNFFLVTAYLLDAMYAYWILNVIDLNFLFCVSVWLSYLLSSKVAEFDAQSWR